MHVAKRIATWFALGCSLACATAALALDPALDVSQYAHTAWKIRDGFVSDPILAIAQTSDGYLWLGTIGGLQRFDGVRAVPWHAPAGTSLPDTRIRALLAARDGTLWIGTRQGLASWDGRKLVVHPELDGRLVDALVEDGDGLIWVAAKPFSGTGARLCAIHDGRTECKDEEGAFGRWIASLLIDKGGALWVASDKGVWRWKPGPPAQYTLPAESGTLQALSQAPSGAILVAASRAIWQIRDGALQPFLAPPAAQAVIPSRQLFTDLHGGVWTATVGRGLIHIREGRIDAFSRADGLSGDDVLRLFEDREGNVWVATTEGLDRFRVLPVPTYSEPQGISGAVAAVLADVDGSVWLSSSEGLHRWHAGRVTVYRGRREPGPRGQRVIAARGPIADETVIEGLPRDAFASLFKDRRGRLWLGSQANFGYVESGRYNLVAGVPPGYLDAIVQATDGSLWFTHRDAGLFRLSEDLELKQFPWSRFGKIEPAMRLAVDPADGGIWIAFYGGGVTHFVDGQVRDAYTAREGLGSGTVHDIRVGSDGTVWAATDKGLSRIKSGHVATLDRRGGLPCDIVQSSIEDDDASTWIYTACGLVRIEHAALGAWLDAVEKGNAPKAIRAMVLDASDGVRNAAQLGTFTPYMTKARDGKIWFVGYGGVSVVDPRNLPFNRLPPPVHIEGIVADRKTYETSTSPPLPALVRDVRIDYTALSFVAPEKVLFRYKLEGRDRDWQDAGNRRQAFYTDLDPGSYRFRVIAANNSGVWNNEGASLDFSIAPAYWQTNWFRALCVGAIIALLGALYLLRVRHLARQFTMTLDARVNERTRIARELHDTLLQSFHGLLLRFQTVADLLPDRPADAKKQLVSAIDQAAEAITEGRDAVQGIRASATEMNDLANAIRNLGETLAAEHGNGDGVTLRVEVLGVARALHPILRDEVFRIAGEALRNSFRHAQATQIEVELRYDARQLRLRVRDDGRGMGARVLADGGLEGHFGLRGMRERAKLIGGKLTVWSAEDSGTEVDLTVPASHAYAADSSQPISELLER